MIPAYDEAATLAANLAELRRRFALDTARSWRLIVVDDGSRDETAAIAERFARADGATTFVRHDRNRGLGAALRSGFAASTGDAVVTVDADLSYGPDIAVRLVDRLLAAGVDVVVASPYGPGGDVAGVPRGRLALSRGANLLVRWALGGLLSTPTSMARAYSRRAVDELRFEAAGMEANLEIVAAALSRGLAFSEIPARLAWRGEAGQRARRTSWRALARQTVRVVRWSFRLRRAVLAARRRGGGEVARTPVEHGA